MCKKCVNPRSQHLKSLDDPFIVGNPHFTAETDTMPDKIHAKPRHMWQEVYKKRSRAVDVKILSAKRYSDELEAEYKALPEPKPDYLEWASSQMRPAIFRELLTRALSGKGDMARIRAISTILEFTKSKPKQESIVIMKKKNSLLWLPAAVQLS